MNLHPAAERGSALWGPSAQQPLSSASLPLERTEHTVVSTNGPKQLKASSWSLVGRRGGGIPPAVAQDGGMRRDLSTPLSFDL